MAAASAIPGLGDAAARSERLFLRAFAFVRLAVLLQSTAAGVMVWDRFRHPVVVVVLLVIALAESVVVVEASRRRAAFTSGALVALDVSVSVVALTTVNWALKASADPYLDAFLYPYTVASMSLVGLAVRWLPGVVGCSLLVSGVYVTTTTAWFGFAPALVPDTLTFWAFSLVVWGLARRYRQLSRELDQARRQAVARQVELELTRERTRNFRDLHDRVLQTLEIMGRNSCVADPSVREHIAAEATWLRQRIESGLDRQPTGLVVALEAVVERQAVAGLQVDLNSARMDEDGLAADVTAALMGAVTEALTNVRKHARVDRAVVRVSPAEDGVMVSVLDHGRGFDPAVVTPGVGLSQSLGARMRQAGGWVRIDSAPGAGTYVELWVPGGLSPEPGTCEPHPGSG